MFEHVLEGLDVRALRRDFQTCNALPPHVVSFMRGVPTATEAPIEALQMYTDGSYYSASKQGHALAGWAICCLALQEGKWCWLGYLASAAPVQGSAATLGEAVGSSFEPELAADVYALALAVATPVPAMLGFDNMAALDVAYGRAMQKAAGPLSQAGLALSHILRLQGRMPGALHIDSHSGHPLNDLADCIAKHLALQQETACVPEGLAMASEQHVLPWLAVGCNMCPELPPVDQTGTFCGGTQQFPPTHLAQCHDFQVELNAR